MRVLFGILLGIGLTVTGAYFYDASRATDASTQGVATRPMVNWEVVDWNWQRLTNRARREWNDLAAR